METVHIKINNVPYEVAAGSTILEAAHSVGIEIPTLCYLKEINAIGACRICVVEVKGARSLVTACVYPVNEGMEIVTNSEKVQASRKTNLELLLSTHDQNCLSCVRSTDCELQKLCRDYGAKILVRAGTSGGYLPQMCNYDIVLSQAVSTTGGINEHLFGGHFSPSADFGQADGARFVRFSIATAPADLDEAIERLRRWLV